MHSQSGVSSPCPERPAPDFPHLFVILSRKLGLRGSVPHAIPTPGGVNRHVVSFFALSSPFGQLVPGFQVSKDSTLALSLRARTSPSQAQGMSPLRPAARPSVSGFRKVALPASCLRPSLPHHRFFSLLIYVLTCLSVSGLLCSLHTRM